MAAEVFAVHGVAATEAGTAKADALIALCDDAMPSDRRSWLVFADGIDAAAVAHIDKIISFSPSTIAEIGPEKIVTAPLDGPALALFEPLPEAPTRALSSVLIDATGDEPWMRRLVEQLLGKYTLTAASRNQEDLAGMIRNDGVWSLVASRRVDWVDLISRHDLVITADPFTAALANGILKPALLIDHDPVEGLPACFAAELDGIADQLSRLDMVAAGADLLNAKRRAHGRALDDMRGALGGSGA